MTMFPLSLAAEPAMLMTNEQTALDVTGSAAAGSPITLQPSAPPPQIVADPAGDDPSLYWPIVAAIVGAFAAQSIAAAVNFRLRSRAEQVDAFDRAYTRGMAARRAMSRHRRIVSESQAQWPAYEALADALTDFRAAELSYQAQFGGNDPASTALAEAVEAIKDWSKPEISDVEMEERAEEQLQEMAGRGQWEYDLSYEMQTREDLRVDGKKLEDKLNEAMTAFGEKTQRRRRRSRLWM